MLTKVKICGITSIADANAAIDAGADAIGLVFYRESKRFIEISEAIEIVRAVGPLVTTVGLFVNEPAESVELICRKVGIHLAQLHGDEDSNYCAKLSIPYIKAIRMAPDIDLRQQALEYPNASAFLFDAWLPDQYGGTGTSFDWRRIIDIDDKPTILAGGLSVDNVREAVALTTPYAVDVSGGVESSPGCKDKVLMAQFIKLAKAI